MTMPRIMTMMYSEGHPNIPNSTPCTVIRDENKGILEIKWGVWIGRNDGKQHKVTFPLSSIVDVAFDTSSETKEKRHSGVGGAIVGELIAGAAGAIVGGLATRHTDTVTKEHIRTFWTVNDGETTYTLRFYEGKPSSHYIDKVKKLMGPLTTNDPS